MIGRLGSIIWQGSTFWRWKGSLGRTKTLANQFHLPEICGQPCRQDSRIRMNFCKKPSSCVGSFTSTYFCWISNKSIQIVDRDQIVDPCKLVDPALLFGKGILFSLGLLFGPKHMIGPCLLHGNVRYVIACLLLWLYKGWEPLLCSNTFAHFATPSANLPATSPATWIISLAILSATCQQLGEYFNGCIFIKK